MRIYCRLALGAITVAASGMVWAQAQPLPGGVYTCVDAKGRKLTADRPIVDCIDREQKVLNPSGTVRAKVGPSLTAQEKLDLEQKEKREAEERGRLAEEKRRDRALLTRYPSKGVHDQERAEALAQIEAVAKAATTRLNELVRQTPEGVYLTTIKQDGNVVGVTGIAQTNERVSEFLRNTAYNSTWLEKPELVEIKAASLTTPNREQKRLFDFVVKVGLKRPQVETPDKSAVPGAAGASGPAAAASVPRS